MRKINNIKNQKIKVVFLVTQCKNSGPINQTLNIIKNLDSEIFEPILVSLFLENKNNSLLYKFRELTDKHFCLELGKIQSLFFGKKKIKKLFSTIKPDIVHSVGMPPYNLSLAYSDTKHLLTLRNYVYDDYPAKYGKILGTFLAIKDMRTIRKRVINNEYFVTCSQSLSKIYKEKEKLSINFIRNGVDTSKYKKELEIELKTSIKDRFNISENAKVAIYTGQFVDRKNQEEAIRGVLEVDSSIELVLLLLGDGPNKELLVEKYGYNKNILFLGSVPNVEDYLKIADIYISTSISEGLPNGVLEAMATGLPLVLSNIVQHKEIFDLNENIGKSYELGNINNLKYQLNSIFSSDLRNMSLNSKSTIEDNLTASLMSDQYQKLYLSMLSNTIVNN